MPSFEIEGKLLKKYDTESKSASFQAREFVLEIVDGNYPQFIKFQLTQDRCSLIDASNEGDSVDRVPKVNGLPAHLMRMCETPIMSIAEERAFFRRFWDNCYAGHAKHFFKD